MARESMINTADDMRWLRDVHLPRLPAKYKSAVIVGNEDYPDRIDVYERRTPRVSDVPVVFKADDEGVFKESSTRAGTSHHATKKLRSDVRAVGGPYTVYYEKAGGESVKTSAATKRQAVSLACAASKMTGGYVTVNRKGIELAACYGGEVVEDKRHHATKKSGAQLDREIAEVLSNGPHADRGDRVLADLERWGIDREQIDEVRAAFRSGDHRRAMALAKDLGWNRAAKRGRSHATRRGASVEVDTSVYRRYHGAEPRGFGDWTFVIGKHEYEYSDDPALYRPAQARGAHKAGRAGLPFAKAKEHAIAEAKRRGATIVGVAP